MRTIAPAAPPAMAPIGTWLQPDVWPFDVFEVELEPDPVPVPLPPPPCKEPRPNRKGDR